MRAVVLLVLLAAPSLAPPAAAAPPREPWWDEAWHFRLPLTVAASGRNPATGAPVDLSGTADVTVFVPVDFTAALRDDGAWPFDAAGRPSAWTLIPESVRVVEIDEAGAARRVLASRVLTFALDEDATAPFDPHSNAAATLAVTLPGRVEAPRRLHVYFDIAENGAKPAAPAELDGLAGPGPGVLALARAPPAPAGARLQLVAMPLAAAADVVVERLPPGAAPEEVARARVAAPVARVPLPAADVAYDFRVTASSPTLLALETVPAGNAAAQALFHAALDGGLSGTRFVVPGLAAAGATLDVVGTAPRTRVTVTDAATGADVAALVVGERESAPLAVPRDAAYRVDASAPVLLLSRGTASADDGSAFLHQAVTLAGAGAGRFLVGARGAGHSVAADAPTSVKAFPLARPADVLSGRAGDPPRFAWTSRGLAAAATEPWAFYADAADVTVLLGSDGLAPLVGRAGGEFRIALASDRPTEAQAEAPLAGVLVAPFGGTRVDVVSRAANGTRVASSTVTLAAPGALDVAPDGSRALLVEGEVTEVRASKPVFLHAYRAGAASTAYLPTLPAVAHVEAGRLEYHGALLAWDEPARTVTARPGERVGVPLTLTNLGRASDGAPLLEEVAIDVEPHARGRCRSSWDASASASSLPALPSPGSRSLAVFVSVPATAAPGECAEVVITATSAQDPRVRVEARVTVRARAAFEPEITVLREDGTAADSTTLLLDSGVPRTVALSVRNAGGAAGEAVVAVAPAPLYRVALAREGGEPAADGRLTVTVPVNASVRVFLTITAPTGTEPRWDFFVQAVSASDPAVRDEALVSARPRANLTVVATADAPRVSVVPGGEGNVTVHLANLGGDAEVRARVATALLPGWSASVTPERTLLRARGALAGDGRALDSSNVTLTLRAPTDASVGQSFPLALAVEPSSGADAGARVPLTAVVVNDYRVAVEALPPVLALPRSEVTVPLAFDSTAAGPFNLTLRGAAAPAGWGARVTDASLRLAPGERARTVVALTVPSGARAGVAEVTLDFDLADGVSPPARLRVTVRATTPESPFLRVDGLPAEVALAAAGGTRLVARVVNDGNRDAEVALHAEADHGATVALDATTLRLAHGEARDVVLLVTAPAEPGYGSSAVVLRASAAGAATEEREVAVRETVRDIAVVAAVIERSPSGASFLNVTVENRGTDAAPGLVLLVTARGEAVAEFAVAGLAPGVRAQHVLPAAPGLDGLAIAVASADDVPDATPSDNALAAEGVEAAAAPAEARASVPAPSALGTGLGLALAAVCGARRRRAA